MRYEPSKLSLNCEAMLLPAASETGISTGTKFLVLFHQLHKPKIPKPKISRATPDFVAMRIAICLGRVSPFGKGAKRVDVIVDYIGVRIFLPAAEVGIFEEVARAALVVDRIQREIQRLAGFVYERF